MFVSLVLSMVWWAEGLNKRLLTDGCEEASQEASVPGGPESIAANPSAYGLLQGLPPGPLANLWGSRTCLHKVLVSAFRWCFSRLSKRRRMGGKAQPQDIGLFTVGQAKISMSTTYAKFIGSYIFPLFTH